MGMSQWANGVMGADRKVQRTLIRARQQQHGKEIDQKATVSEPQRDTFETYITDEEITIKTYEALPTSPVTRVIDDGDGEVRQEREEDEEGD